MTVEENTKKEVQRQMDMLKRGSAEVIPEDLLETKLTKSISENKALRIKLGVDPSAPDLHLGHTVVLEKLRTFQELGHQVLFLIGDFTAQIGDPTGKSETRKNLTREETKQNAKTYADQVLKVLDPVKTQIVFNSQWSDNLKIQDIIKLCAQMTVARMLERDDFAKRYSDKQPISIHEFLYPILQAYDSVQLRADVELGGTDQKFNILLGREYQKHFGQEPQVAILSPLLEGTDGKQKMSKSLGNAIGITESPTEIFGKIMSIDDDLMIRYYELLTQENISEIKNLHPRDAKIKLASTLVSRFHGDKAGLAEANKFIEQFSKKSVPEDIKHVVMANTQAPLTKVMVEHDLAPSLNEARRLIQQGAVSVNGEKVSDITLMLTNAKEVILKVGKRKYLKVSTS
jgi:tyrosyl-tRNA synthetase